MILIVHSPLYRKANRGIKNEIIKQSGDKQQVLPGSIAGGYICCFKPFLAAYLLTALPAQFLTLQTSFF